MGVRNGSNTYKVTKTSLYKLVSEYTKLPIMKKTEYEKLNQWNHWLRWVTSEGDCMTAYFGLIFLPSVLVIEGGREDQCHDISLNVLQEKGLIA